MGEEVTRERSELITLRQTGGKPDQMLVEELTRAINNMTVKGVSQEIQQMQRETTTKTTIVKRGRLDFVSEEQLNRIEDYNLARRIGSDLTIVPPGIDEVRKGSKALELSSDIS